jgi:hypothetical protein
MRTLSKVAPVAQRLEILGDRRAALAPRRDVVNVEFDPCLRRGARAARAARESISLKDLEAQTERRVAGCSGGSFSRRLRRNRYGTSSVGAIGVLNETLKRSRPRPKPSRVWRLRDSRRREGEFAPSGLASVVLPEREDVFEQFFILEPDLIGYGQPSSLQGAVPGSEAPRRGRVVVLADEAVLLGCRAAGRGRSLSEVHADRTCRRAASATGLVTASGPWFGTQVYNTAIATSHA